MMKSSVLLLFLMCNLQLVHGSVIALQATPTVIKDGLTSTVVLRCEVKDTSVSTSIIGRRDVTQTADNMASVTSIIMMKDGRDVASVSTTRPPHVMDGSSNTRVAGVVTSGVTAGQGGEGFLQVTIADPGRNQSGEFVCEANAVSESGHMVTFSEALEITVDTPSIADLVTYVRELKHENEDLKKKDEEMQQTITDLKTKVFFSAGLSKDLVFSSGQHVIVYDKIFANVGGAYNKSSGIFTCGIDGYYKFTINVHSAVNKRYFVHLQHNHQSVIDVYAKSHSEDGHSNSVIIKLVKGDVVNALADGDNYLFQAGTLMYNTLSGELLMKD